eukprot:TRINITY_DN73798_c0_g1_i1.p1 TRINITY_DN73798_c0_g1~~TRINITY_DN73798_c0_g1_i1.p1  ORF type:complete len:434 (-),score=74.87 TRINITY_DN73798_c0_g1_i1:68-1369(-)
MQGLEEEIKTLRAAAKMAAAAEEDMRNEMVLIHDALPGQATFRLWSKFGSPSACQAERILNQQVVSKCHHLQRRNMELETLVDNLRLEQKCQSLQCGAVWQFESQPSKWSRMPPEASAKLQAYGKGAEQTRIEVGDILYQIDFQSMTQRSLFTGKTRKIRCKYQTPQHWERCVDLASILRPFANRFMQIAVEVLELERFQKLLQFSVLHHGYHAGESSCDCMKRAQVARVLRAENFHLWTTHHNLVQLMRSDLRQRGVHSAPLHPSPSAVLSDLTAEYVDQDSEVLQTFLFHGTSFQTAAAIAQEGFDPWLSGPGYYGHGTYFATQACESHQCSTADKEKCNGIFQDLHTILVSRVASGSIWYADKVDPELLRPPLQDEVKRRYDCVVAKPGPLPGHNKLYQSLQEVVIFEKAQAYPDFIVQYFIPADPRCAD